MWHELFFFEAKVLTQAKAVDSLAFRRAFGVIYDRFMGYL
jgi:hypothetical protein